MAAKVRLFSNIPFLFFTPEVRILQQTDKTMDSPLRKMNRLLIPVMAGLLLAGVLLLWHDRKDASFLPREKQIILQSDSVMYVTVLPQDSLILRTPVRDLPKALLHTDLFHTLAAKMLATVRSPQQDGVGIAAPQVGISRRLAWVQRYDKEGEPWELYPNIRILAHSGGLTHDPEGCLSVPPLQGRIPRHETVVISWTDPQTLEERRDTVHGYTAIIFQHECDHMEGTVCTDRADSVWTSPSWAAERALFDADGAYQKPEWW